MLVGPHDGRCSPTGGPAANNWLRAETMTEKCETQVLSAARPTTGPSKTEATGHVARSLTC